MIFILVEIRNENTIDISGYVNVVERESRKLACGGGKPDFYEKVKAGTFDKALQKNPAVPIFFNHERPISTDSLPELREDNVGLHAHAVIRDPEVVLAAKQNKLTGWSFSFRCLKDNWTDETHRTLEDIDLLEVSVLTKTPAYIATSVECREDGTHPAEQRCTGDPVTIVDHCTKQVFQNDVFSKAIEIEVAAQ